MRSEAAGIDPGSERTSSIPTRQSQKRGSRPERPADGTPRVLLPDERLVGINGLTVEEEVAIFRARAQREQAMMATGEANQQEPLTRADAADVGGSNVEVHATSYSYTARGDSFCTNVAGHSTGETAIGAARAATRRARQVANPEVTAVEPATAKRQGGRTSTGNGSSRRGSSQRDNLRRSSNGDFWELFSQQHGKRYHEEKVAYRASYALQLLKLVFLLLHSIGLFCAGTIECLSARVVETPLNKGFQALLALDLRC